MSALYPVITWLIMSGQLGTAAQHHEPWRREKFKVWFLLNVYCFCIIVKSVGRSIIGGGLSGAVPRTTHWILKRSRRDAWHHWETVLGYVRSSCVHEERRSSQAVWLSLTRAPPSPFPLLCLPLLSGTAQYSLTVSGSISKPLGKK